MNSSGSVTPVKKTAKAAEKYIDLYLAFYLHRHYDTSPKPSPLKSEEPIIWPTLNRAGVQFSKTN